MSDANKTAQIEILRYIERQIMIDAQGNNPLVPNTELDPQTRAYLEGLRRILITVQASIYRLESGKDYRPSSTFAGDFTNSSSIQDK